MPALPEFSIPANDASFRTRVYAGAALGATRLEPATEDTVFTLEDGDASATQLRVGVDVHNMLAVELESSVLGTAELREAGTDVSYSAASLNALIYALGGVQMRSRREGWTAYGRLGFGALSRSSDVLPLDGSSTGPILGLGAEYGFDNGLGIRGELTRYDGEAVFAGVGAVYRFGVTPREVGRLLADTARPALAAEATRVGADGRSTPPGSRVSARGGAEPQLAAAAPAARSVRGAASRANDVDGDGVLDSVDRCAGTDTGVSVDRDGCGLFDAVLGDVVFKSGSWWLNARARGALDDVADKLLAFPEVRLEVQAHTDSKGAADRNLALSARRAEAVVAYLRSRGIAELQLTSRGVGETRPLASNDSEIGRRRNRRIELETLPDLSGEVLAGRAVDGSVWHYPMVREAEDLLALDAARVAARAPAQAVSADSDGPSAPAAAEPSLAAARTAPAAQGVPPIGGLKPALVPAPGRIAGFRMQGVLAGLGFERGSDTIQSGGDRAIAQLADALKRYPEARIAVMAHTDSLGDADANRALSEARAGRVIGELLQRGIASTRLVAEGYGDTLPLVQALTDEDHGRNRRIEIRLLR